jgi:hypothetical protein
MAGSLTVTEPNCLSVLLYSMQLAFFGLPSVDLVRDSLPLVLKVVLTTANGSCESKSIDSSSVHDFNRLAAVDVAIIFSEGLARR